MNNSNRAFIVDVEEDAFGEQYITLPEQVIAETGWKDGDNIEWTDNKDGSWTMTKKEIVEEPKETEIVIVETVSMFKISYAVEVPKGMAHWALDTVAMNEAGEFTQNHLSETIVTHRVVDKQGFIAEFDAAEPHAANWTEHMKLSCIHKIKE